jgi:hypothetical protein
MINVIKSQPAPPCLELEKNKRNGSYDCDGVRNRLQADFFNKCYICEDLGPTSLDIEHFIAHEGNQDLKFDWANLFFSCSHCNNTKSNRFVDILDCTDFAQIITKCIQFEINPFPKEKVRFTALIDSNVINNTIKLLNEVFNGNTIRQTMEAENLRRKLIDEILNFTQLLNEYYQVGWSPIEKEKQKREIARLLSQESAFTAFKIWIIKSNPDRMAEFGALLPDFEKL